MERPRRVLPTLTDHMPRVAQGDRTAYNEALSLINAAAPDPDLPRPWRISFHAKKRELTARLAAAWGNGPGGVL